MGEQEFSKSPILPPNLGVTGAGDLGGKTGSNADRQDLCEHDSPFGEGRQDKNKNAINSQ